MLTRALAVRVDLPLATRQWLLIWSLWLAGSWMTTLQLVSFPHAPRILVLLAFVGVLLIWPAFRLSQRGWQHLGQCTQEQLRIRRLPGVLSVRPMSEASAKDNGPWLALVGVLLDWMVLVLVFQAVMLPLFFMTDWSPQQALAINLGFVTWSWIISWPIAWGCLSDRGRDRVLAMSVCLLLVATGPLVLWVMSFLGPRPSLAPSASGGGPLEFIWWLAGVADVTHDQLSGFLWSLAVMAVLALIGWLLLIPRAVGHQRQGVPVGGEPLKAQVAP